MVVDFGKGIPKEVLEGLHHSGTNVGVGLAGIRESAKELGGTFEVDSGPTGTTLKACVPLAARSSSVFEADPTSQIHSSLVS